MPPEWLEPLARLQDEVAAGSWETIRAFGAAHLPRWNELEIDPVALAAASFAEVHRARTPQGEEVVVKIRHPGLPEMVRSDLRSARLAVYLLSKFVPRLSLDEAYDAIRTSLLTELDLAHEGKSLETFATQFEGKDWAWLKFPKVHWDYTCAEILCLTWIPHPTLREAMPRVREERQRVFEQIARIWYHSVFTHGFFHADPHPGNILVSPEGELYLIDFGMMGRVDDKAASGLRQTMFSLVDMDAAGMAEGYRRMGIVRNAHDQQLLVELFDEILTAFRHATPQSIALLAEASGLQQRSMDLVWKAQDLRFPHQIVLLFRAEGVIEGLATLILPEDTLPQALAPALDKFRQNASGILQDEVKQWLRMARALPGDVREVLELVREGKLQVRSTNSTLEHVYQDLRKIFFRVLEVLGAVLLCWWGTGFQFPTELIHWLYWTILVFVVFRFLRLGM
jgi:predicted unusual protein kinase regulating ubiquinone biosynthesis (AarF/ABC1/UbiB family)